MSFDTFYFYNGNMEFKEIILDDLNHEELKELIGVNNTNLDLLIDEIKFVVSLDSNNLKLIKEYVKSLKIK